MEELAEFGASVYTCARTESELNERLKEWKDAGLTVTGSVCDVSSRPEREKLMQDVSSAFGGKLNILVNMFIINNVIMYNSSIYSHNKVAVIMPQEEEIYIILEYIHIQRP